MLNLKKVLFPSLISLFLNHQALGFVDPTHHSDFDKPEKNFGCYMGTPRQDQKTRIQFVKEWSASVAKRSFTLPTNNTDDYFERLKPCFSNEGWTSYTKALEQSGNLKLIQTKRFQGTSQVIGMISVSHEESSYIWEVNVPITLIYQNQYQKLIQELIVHLSLSEQSQGHFKVEQVVGFPKQRKLNPILNSA